MSTDHHHFSNSIGNAAMEDQETATAANSAQSAPLRPIGRPFVKGQSGNPRGRPRRDYDLAELARVQTPAALATLAEIMSDKSAQPSARVAAASAILDRGWGKAPQSLDLKHSLHIADEFEALIREISGHRELKGSLRSATCDAIIDVE
jgi:hypothetical protein